jgi:hypothetical protein
VVSWVRGRPFPAEAIASKNNGGHAVLSRE